MKLSPFLVAVVFCGIVGSLNIIPANSLKENDFNSNFVSNDVAIEAFGMERSLISWPALNVVIRKALSIILGVKCTVREVLEVKEAALDFLNDVEKCGNDVSASVRTLIVTCQKIIRMCDKILHINKKICGNSDEPEESDNSKTPSKCFKKLYKSFVELKDTVYEALILTKNITKVPGEASSCVTNVCKDLEAVFIKFPIKMEFCSSLIH